MRGYSRPSTKSGEASGWQGGFRLAEAGKEGKSEDCAGTSVYRSHKYLAPSWPLSRSTGFLDLIQAGPSPVSACLLPALPGDQRGDSRHGQSAAMAGAMGSAAPIKVYSNSVLVDSSLSGTDSLDQTERGSRRLP